MNAWFEDGRLQLCKTARLVLQAAGFSYPLSICLGTIPNTSLPLIHLGHKLTRKIDTVFITTF